MGQTQAMHIIMAADHKDGRTDPCSMPINFKWSVGDTLVTRIDVYDTLCPQQMPVDNGGKIKNRGGECRDVTPTKLQCLNIQRALQVFYKK